mmetsp:Transcript_21307/g.47058  ORF Transcript_21307/g.47058 Transcript_21307/m.47058 type:complete len:235 (+) Transcript_21307:58-762(+)
MPATRRGNKRRAGVCSTSPQGLDARFFKTKLCSFYAMGKCTRGSRCTFAHTEEDVKDTPDLYRTKPCRDFALKGFCELGDSCQFAHNPDLIYMPEMALAMMKLDDGADSRATTAFLDDFETSLTLGDSKCWSRQSTAEPREGPPLCEFSDDEDEAWCSISENSGSKKLETWADICEDGEEEVEHRGSAENKSKITSSCVDDDEGPLELAVKNTFLQAVPSASRWAHRRANSATW